MGWHDELGAIAAAYNDGLVRVERRRQLWATVLESLVVPTLTDAANVLREGGVHASVSSGGTFELPDVQTGWTGNATPADRGGTDPSYDWVEVERGARMGYSQGRDGYVGAWMFGFSRVRLFPNWSGHHPGETVDEAVQRSLGDPRPDPESVTVHVVREHLENFLRLALASSFRGR